MKTERILIVADDSPPSVKAVKYGFNLAAKLKAKVLLLTVADEALMMGNPDAGVFPDDALIAMKGKAEDFLNRMKEKYADHVDTELMAQAGDVQTVVIDTAVKWKADLIISGTHGRKGLNKLFKGSIAESIIRNSPVPVCVVPTGR